MLLFDRLFGKPQLVFITVRPEIQGDHGISGPAQGICDVIKEWLVPFFVATPPLDFLVQINYPTGRARAGKAVKTICASRTSKLTIELRVRPPKQPFFWCCYLVCPTEDITNQLLSWDHPEAVDFARRIIPIEEKIVRSGQANHRFPGPDRLEREAKELLRVLRSFQKRSNLRQLCGKLNEQSPGELPFDRSLIRQVLCKSINRAISETSLDQVLRDFTLMGIIEPTSSDGHRFCKTMLFEEISADYQDEKLTKQKEQLLGRLESKQRLYQAAHREWQRLLEQADDKSQIAANLSIEIGQLEQDLEHLLSRQAADVFS